MDGWGVFRYRDTEEPMINATIESGFPTGITNFSEDNLQLQVFPNPASDNVYIDYTSSTNEKVWLVIMDLQGKILNRYDLGVAGNGNQTFSLNADRYAAGMYLVELYSGNNKKMEKLVINE
jgi:hypothetical protein